jgi:Tol biopolymer transport system component
MHRSKIFLWLLGLVLTAFFLVPMQEALSQESADELYEAAVFKKEAEGDLEGAIQIFLKVIAKFPESRKVAAKAQLQIGICYEKLGTKEAEKAFQKVIDNYPEQSEAVSEAKEKLAFLLMSRAFIETGDKEFKIRQVWTGPGADVEGAVSPDGRFLSFVDWETGDLAIRELGTGKNRRLTNKGSWMQSQEFALFSKWSPDGRQLVYQWYKDQFFELRVIDIDQLKSRVLHSNKEEYVHPFDWSPDGKQVLALIGKMDVNAESLGDRPNATFQLALISAEDGAIHYLKSFAVGFNRFPFSFAFSPDGKSIAYDSPQEDSLHNRDIYLLSADGSREVRLVEHPALDYVLGWTCGGNGLLFASERTGSSSVWHIQVVDGKPQGSPKLIKPDIGPIHTMGFTRQGAFFYGISSEISDVYITKLDPATGKILDPAKSPALNYEGHNAFPAYSPDGMFLAYMSRRGTLANLGGRGTEVLCLLSLKTGQIRELIPDLPMYGYPRWSPDGRFISLEGRGKDGRPCIYRFDPQTGDAIPLVQFEHGKNIFSHRWSKDGKSVIYARGGRSAEPSYVYVHDIETGQEKQLLGSPSDAKDIDISPDGKWLVLINRDKKRTIKIMPVAGGDPREIYSFEQGGNPVITPAWSADGRYILFSKKRPDPDQMWDLYRVSAEGGEAQKIDLSINEFRHLSVHPDGQQIAFSSGGFSSRYAEVWVMENFLPVEKVKK